MLPIVGVQRPREAHSSVLMAQTMRATRLYPMISAKSILLVVT
jgi:hypothetical protein